MSIALLLRQKSSLIKVSYRREGFHLLTVNFSNFKMSYLIQYLSYVHTVFGFQLLLTHSVLNSTKIKTTPNLNFKTNMTSSIMTSYSDKFYKKVFLNDWHVESRRSASCCRTACLHKYSNSVVWVSAFWVFTLDSGAWVSAFIVFWS